MRDLTPQNAPDTSPVDIQLEPNGDIRLLDNGDIALDSGADALEQAIRWRLMTYLGSWALEPQCGTRLVDFAGAPNSERTAMQIQGEVYRALSHDGFLMPDEIDVQVFPIAHNRMAVVMLLNPSVVGDRAAFQFEIDLVTGELDGWQRVS